MNTNTDTDDLTEELSKLLSSDNDKKNIKSKKDKKSKKITKTETESSSYSDSDTESNKTDKKSREKLSSKDLISAVAELRMDTVKIMEMLNCLNNEINALKKNKNYAHSDDSDFASTCQEQVDKILSNKIDEFSLRVDKKMNEMNELIMSTREIARNRRY